MKQLSDSDKDLSAFYQVFQKGFGMRVQTGCSVRSVLCDQWKIPPDYVRDRISIVFLNGRPLDDLESAQVDDGATLVLSGAMPGLVGAAMRRGSYYNTIRSTISYEPTAPSNSPSYGIITVKLFNMVLHELTEAFLRKGALIRTEDAQALLEHHSGSFVQNCSDWVSVTPDSRPHREKIA